MKYTLTTDEAATQLGVTRPRVQQLIKFGVLDSIKVRRDRMISQESVNRAKGRKTKRGPVAKTPPAQS